MKTDKILFGTIIVLLVFLGIVVLSPKEIVVKTEVTTAPPVGAAGDIARTARIHQKGITAATSTICALYHTDGRDRIVTKAYTWNADDTGGGNNLVTSYTLTIATSTSASATSTSGFDTTAYANAVAWATTSAGSFYSTSTPATSGNTFTLASGTTSAATTFDDPDTGLYVWPTATYFLFKLMDGVNGMGATTSAAITGFCGVEYYPDM